MADNNGFKDVPGVSFSGGTLSGRPTVEEIRRQLARNRPRPRTAPELDSFRESLRLQAEKPVPSANSITEEEREAIRAARMRVSPGLLEYTERSRLAAERLAREIEAQLLLETGPEMLAPPSRPYVPSGAVPGFNSSNPAPAGTPAPVLVPSKRRIALPED